MTKKEEVAQVRVSHETMIATALNGVMKDVTYVQKGGQVKFGSTKYSYVSEANFLEAARPAMVKHGLALLPSCVELRESGNKVYVHMSYTLTHTSGAVWPKELFMWGCGEDRGDKAVYKAITGANKYMLFKLLNVPTGEDPESGTQPEEQSTTKPAATKTEVETPYKMPDKEKVLKTIMKEFPGASEEARNNRLAALNQNLLAINGDPVNSPDQVTDAQWDNIARGMKL